MHDLVRDATDILEVAARAMASGAAQYMIYRTGTGALNIVSDGLGWSFAGLAAEYGATEIFRVKRNSLAIVVEGWSPGNSCVLTRGQVARPALSDFAVQREVPTRRTHPRMLR